MVVGNWRTISFLCMHALVHFRSLCTVLLQHPLMGSHTEQLSSFLESLHGWRRRVAHLRETLGLELSGHGAYAAGTSSSGSHRAPRHDLAMASPSSSSVFHLRLLFDILMGDPQALVSTSTTWYEILVARLLFCSPELMKVSALSLCQSANNMCAYVYSTCMYVSPQTPTHAGSTAIVGQSCILSQ